MSASEPPTRWGRHGREVATPDTLISLAREIAGYEVRRLLGRPPRRRLGHASTTPFPVATGAVPAPPAPSGPSERWVQLVADHAMTLVSAPETATAAPPRADRFEALDLGGVTAAAARLVRHVGSVPRDDLVPRLTRVLGLERLRTGEERLLGRLVFSAKGRRMIALEEGAWVPGPVAPGPIAELRGRSLDDLARLAADLADEDDSGGDLFPAVLAELTPADERAPRIVAVVAGAGIALARRRGLVADPRAGHRPLFPFEEAG